MTVKESTDIFGFYSFQGWWKIFINPKNYRTERKSIGGLVQCLILTPLIHFNLSLCTYFPLLS